MSKGSKQHPFGPRGGFDLGSPPFNPWIRPQAKKKSNVPILPIHSPASSIYPCPSSVYPHPILLFLLRAVSKPSPREKPSAFTDCSRIPSSCCWTRAGCKKGTDSGNIPYFAFQCLRRVITASPEIVQLPAFPK